MMMHQSELSAIEYHELMLGMLKEQADNGVDYAIWAIEMIVRLHERWGNQADVLQGIRDLLDEA